MGIDWEEILGAEGDDIERAYTDSLNSGEEPVYTNNSYYDSEDDDDRIPDEDIFCIALELGLEPFEGNDDSLGMWRRRLDELENMDTDTDGWKECLELYQAMQCKEWFENTLQEIENNLRYDPVIYPDALQDLLKLSFYVKIKRTLEKSEGLDNIITVIDDSIINLEYLEQNDHLTYLQETIYEFNQMDPDDSLIKKITEGSVNLSAYCLDKLITLSEYLQFRKDLRRLGEGKALSAIPEDSLTHLLEDVVKRRVYDNWPDVKTPDIDAASETVEKFIEEAERLALEAAEKEQAEQLALEAAEKEQAKRLALESAEAYEFNDDLDFDC